MLDTNFLLVPVQFKVDIFRQLRGNDLVTLDLCVKELEKISKGKGKSAEHSKIALDLLKKRKIRIIKANKPTDSSLMNYAQQHNCAVATNDRKLIKRLKNKGIKVIRLSQKKYIVGV